MRGLRAKNFELFSCVRDARNVYKVYLDIDISAYDYSHTSRSFQGSR